MRRFTYTGCLFAVAVAATGGTAYAQQACEQEIQQLESEIQQRQLDQQAQRQIEELLSAAEGTSAEDCQRIVAEAREQLDAAQSQQSQQVAQAPQQQQQQQQQQRSPQEQQRAAQAQGGRQGQDDTTDVRIQQPAAEVQVDPASPQVQVEQPAPQVTVEQPAPEVQITQPEPEVTVQQEEPQVTVDQAEPEVEVSQAEPQVQVRQGEPEVRVAQPEQEADVQVRESEQERQQAQAEQRTTTPGSVTESEAQELVGNNVISERGEEIGEISSVGRSLLDSQLHALVDVGGFLGIGERTVAIPLERGEIGQDGNLVIPMTREELEQMEPADPQQYATIEEEGRFLQ